MRRLTSYLARLFATDAVILFGVMCVLLWLVNCLRSFDVVSVKGQGITTLAYQAMLTMPPLALVFFYVCVGIGMARALQALQTNHELHIIHTSHGLGALWRATMVVAVVGAICVLILSNFLDPYSQRRLNLLNDTVAADLVSSTLKPQRFTQVTPGVVLLIGGRAADGEITQFFADDRRDPQTRRTYVAESARVSSTGDNYVLQLRNGTLQYIESDGRYSQVSFERYDLGVENLSQPLAAPDPVKQTDSVTLILEALQTGTWSAWVVRNLSERLAEGVRVVAICILVLAFAGFPSGKRARIALPLEVIVLLLAFVERGVSSYSPLGPATGSLLMIIVSGGIIFARVRPRRIAISVAT